MKNAIMILGPNGVGKTKFAFQLARRCRGEVINLDRTYLYKGFPIATGMQDMLKELGVQRHLYEVLEPHENSYSCEEMLERVLRAMDEIHSRGNWAIVEGGSTLYTPFFLNRNAKQRIFDRLLGLRFPPEVDVIEKYRLRIEQAFHDGLEGELRSKLSEYRKSFLIQECHFAVPTVKYIEGRIDLLGAKNEILARCLSYKDRQMKLFSEFKDIEWV